MFSLLKTIILSQEQLEKRNRIYFKQKEEKKKKSCWRKQDSNLPVKEIGMPILCKPPKNRPCIQTDCWIVACYV